ncbi:MAG: phosphopantetheine-binding protein, partial [Cyanobacteria bacterium J06626_6]
LPSADWPLTPSGKTAEGIADEIAIVAYYATHDLAQTDGLSAELRQYVQRLLPDYMVPSAFVPMADWPLTPSGKVDRRALPDPDPSHRAVRNDYVAPRTPIEQQLAEIWQDLLKLERVGVHDSFFELGGHSLLATQVVSRIRAGLSVELPLRQFFDTPTIALLATKITEMDASDLAFAIPIARRGRQRIKRSTLS